MSEHVRVESQDRVMTITIHRPEAKNALSHDMYSAMAEALQSADGDDGIRCVILTGTDEVFTAGNDLADFANPRPDGEFTALRFLRTLRDMDTPVLAAVNGLAIGVGLTLLLHCDLVFASEAATFSAPFTRLGVVPEAGSSLLLPQAMGKAWATDLLLTGRVLGADEALSAGLVSRVTAREDLLDLARDVAGTLAARAPDSVRKSKRLIRSDRHDVTVRMKAEEAVFMEQLRSPEFSESLRAVREKREPEFD